ncbi:MAG: hypothetical protein JHC12_05455 [Thermogladius sp.]|nr:hypothetical protein [Thermogladius sp.]
MSRYLSRGLVLLSLLVVGSLASRIESTAGAVACLTLSILVINVAFYLRGRVGSWSLIAVLGGLLFSTTLLKVLSIIISPQVGDYTDVLLILFVIVMLALYNYSEVLRALLSPLTPIGVLVSTILGIYLGLDDPLRYVLAYLIDLTSSSTIIYTTGGNYSSLVDALLVFLTLYINPVMGVGLYALIILLAFHVARNILAELNRYSLARMVGFLDVILRPLVVAAC